MIERVCPPGLDPVLHGEELIASERRHRVVDHPLGARVGRGLPLSRGQCRECRHDERGFHGVRLTSSGFTPLLNLYSSTTASAKFWPPCAKVIRKGILIPSTSRQSENV